METGRCFTTRWASWGSSLITHRKLLPWLIVLLVLPFIPARAPAQQPQAMIVTSALCDERTAPGDLFVGQLEPGDIAPGTTGLTASAVERLATGIETLNKVVGLLENITGRHLPSEVKIPSTFLPAFVQDLQAAREGRFSPLTSHTLEQLGKFGLHTLPTVVEHLKAEGKLPHTFKILPTTFGIDELVVGAASQVGRGRMGIDELTHYLDGASKMTAAIAGYLVTQSPQGAKIAESAAGLAQSVLRGLTMPIFQELANQPVRQDMISKWQAHQESGIFYGQPVQRFSEFYPPAELKQVGFHPKTIGELDRYADWAKAAKGGANLRAPLLPVSEQSTRHQLQVVVIDIPGIRTQGEDRPTKWGPYLIGANFARHNIRHEGWLRDHWQPEPGNTVTLPRQWNEAEAPQKLKAPLNDVAAGKNAYIKVDANIGLTGYLTTGKPGERQWQSRVADFLVMQVREHNPHALVIVNTHSEGTLAAHEMKTLDRVNRGLLGSDRTSLGEVQRLVTAHPKTQFTVLVADRDFAHGLGGGFEKLTGSNVTVINLKSGGLLPTTIHSQVQDPLVRGQFDVTRLGIKISATGTLGELVRGDVQRTPVKQVGGVWLCAQYQTIPDTTGQADELGDKALQSRPEAASPVWGFEESGQQYKAGRMRNRKATP